ncbi:hypothetical protein GCM10027295_29630 [Pseudaeromonas pectinilytica]
MLMPFLLLGICFPIMFYYLYFTYKNEGVADNIVVLVKSVDASGVVVAPATIAFLILTFIFAKKRMWTKKAMDVAKWYSTWLVGVSVVFMYLNHGKISDTYLVKRSAAISSESRDSSDYYSCNDFTSIGPIASSYVELMDKNPTKEQVELVKDVIADRAYEISLTKSPKKDALEIVMTGGVLTKFVGEAMQMTRAYCFINPRNSMKDTAIENFDDLLNAVVKKYNL